MKEIVSSIEDIKVFYNYLSFDFGNLNCVWVLVGSFSYFNII